MTSVFTSQNSFASGEIDPRLIGQDDIKAYTQGARRCRNVARLMTGGLERRFGSYDLGSIGARARLEPFEFSDTQRYVFAFYAGNLKIFDINGVLLQTIAAPWTEQSAFELTYTQLADTMIICHQDFAFQKLVRTSAVTFSMAPMAFDQSANGNKVYQPYYKFADPSVTMTPSAATGAITLTSSAPVFVAGHVGLRFRLYDIEVKITAVTSPTVANGTVYGEIKQKLDLDPFKTKAGTTTVEVLHLYHGFATGASITLSGCNGVGGIVAASMNGARTITVIDEHRYSFVAGGAATTSEDGGGTNVELAISGAAIRSWFEPSISAVRGHPGACCFHEGRLWLGATSSQPDGVWSSQALAYFNFDVGKGYDGDSVQGQIGSEDISRIRHLISNGELQAFTSTRELVYITRDGEPITPGNQRIKTQSVAGTGDVQPIVFDGATLFVQENGLSVSEFSYSNEQGGYLAVPVSTLAGHLIRDPKAAAATPGMTNRAEQYAFFVNADGTVAVFHSLRSENLAGWMLWELGGGALAQSVTTLGPYVFFCVSVRGEYRLYRLASDALVSLDGAVLHTAGGATSAWTLDARVRGRTVHLVSELGYHGEIVVPAGGAITLGTPVTNLVAGDSYFGLIETLPPVVQLANGKVMRTIKRLVRTMLDIYETAALVVDGRRLNFLSSTSDWESGVTPFTGIRQVGHLGFSRAPTTVITQLEPLPFTVLALTQEVKV